jgi:hypothetical protein
VEELEFLESLYGLKRTKRPSEDFLEDRFGDAESAVKAAEIALLGGRELGWIEEATTDRDFVVDPGLFLAAELCAEDGLVFGRLVFGGGADAFAFGGPDETGFAFWGSEILPVFVEMGGPLLGAVVALSGGTAGRAFFDAWADEMAACGATKLLTSSVPNGIEFSDTHGLAFQRERWLPRHARR